VIDGVFERSYSTSSRLAAVRAATLVALLGLPPDCRRDLEQEALCALWRARLAFDPRRASWHAFSERVVANHLSSLARQMRSQRSGQFREEPLEEHHDLAAPHDLVDLRLDVTRVLARVSPFDRRVALCLIDGSPTDTSRTLGISRASAYRAIGRLRTAFMAAGLAPLGRTRGEPFHLAKGNRCAGRRCDTRFARRR
jgi:DNA-directed RNA polymerase specialized sigma24 family protein